MSEDAANPADVAEQHEDVVPQTRDEEASAGADVSDVPEVPDEANEADVLEQHVDVPAEDDDEPDRG